MAISILKNVLSGKALDTSFLSCIRDGCDRCTLSFKLSSYGRLVDEKQTPLFSTRISPCYEIDYDFDISKRIEVAQNDFDSATNEISLVIENEILKVKEMDSEGNIRSPKQVFFDTRKENSDDKGIAFGNKSKHTLFTWCNKKEYVDAYRMIKASTMEARKSFLFSDKFIDKFDEMFIKFTKSHQAEILKGVSSFDYSLFSNESQLIEGANKWAQGFKSKIKDSAKKEKINDEEVSLVMYSLFLAYMITSLILTGLSSFGRNYLHIIDTTITGITNVNSQLPLLLWHHSSSDAVSSYKIYLRMDYATKVSEKNYKRIIQALGSVSKVLNTIIPDMSLGIKDLGKSIEQDNETSVEKHSFEILSNRGTHSIPLKYESDGIRRLVSILSMLIAVYNEKSFTIAIDEIDSGIYEYLLGELLSILSESMKGQFIFTSHNLRPLEVLPAKYLCFTTTNPNNRFTTIPNRGNSNLRDTYFRNIVLGSDKEQIYDPTDKFEIERAFYKAGHPEDDEQ